MSETNDALWAKQAAARGEQAAAKPVEDEAPKAKPKRKRS